MSFLCPSVGLLKLRRFTRTGFATPMSRGLRSNVRSRGASVSFGRAGSQVSIASQGGFSAVDGEVGPNDTEKRAGTATEPRANNEESFGGIYIGGDTSKPQLQKTVRNPPTCGHQAPDVEYFAQDPATVQSFTFFEDSFESSQQQPLLDEQTMEDEMTNNGAKNEQQTPLLSNSSLTPSSSSRKRAHYNLPNWVRQRRCLPNLNEIDFDMIDAISLGGLSISSEIDIQDENNNVPAATESSKWLEVNNVSAKGTRSESSCDNTFQVKNPNSENCQFGDFMQGETANSVYSPKKTKRNDSVTTDDSVFESEPLVQENIFHNPLTKLRPATKVGNRKSPGMGSLRRRSKKRGSFLQPKQPVDIPDNPRPKRPSNTGTHQTNIELTNSENIAKVGSLVRSKALYMRATSERALDPSAMKLRLESSKDRKWRQTADRSPLSEVTNVNQPQVSVCLRMEIVQRPVITQGQELGEQCAASPRKTRELHQGAAKLPAGKMRPTSKRSKSVYFRDGRGRIGSLRRRSTEVKMESPQTENVIAKTIDSRFRSNNKAMQEISNRDELPTKENQNTNSFAIHSRGASVSFGGANSEVSIASQGGFSTADSEIGPISLAKAETIDSRFRSNNKAMQEISNRDELPTKENPNTNSFAIHSLERPENPAQNHNKYDPSGPIVVNDKLRKRETSVAEEIPMKNTETDPQQQQPKNLVQKTRFADNSVKKARIVSTSKMAVEEADNTPLLPPKMIKSASFTATSRLGATDLDKTVPSKPATRSATNVRALQIPLSQQQRRKVKAKPPGNKHGRGHRVSAVEASRQDIVEVVAAMKASLDSTKDTEGKTPSRRATSFVIKDLGDAVAMYDFEARTEDDVTVNIGDVVTVLNKDDPDWLFVKKHVGTQKEGFVPRIFLQVKNSEQESTQSRVLSKVDDNSVKSATEVSEQQLDTIPEIEKKQPFCRQFVDSQPPNSYRQHQLVQTVQTNQMLLSDQGVGQPDVENATGIKTTNQSQSRFAEARGPRHHPTSQSRPRSGGGVLARKFNTNIRGGASLVLIETYVVVSDYTEQDDDEVSVVEGEIVVVNSGQQHEMDWMWVYVPRTERFGFVPAFSARPLGFHFSDV